MGDRLFTDKLVLRWLEGVGAWSLDSATHTLLLAASAYPAHASGLSELHLFEPGVGKGLPGIPMFDKFHHSGRMTALR
jgi:hypothetical protein